MNWFKKSYNKLKNLKSAFAILYSVVSIAVIITTIVLLCLGYSNSVFAYIMYFLSAIALVYLVFMCIFYIPKMKKLIVKLMKKNKFTNELLESFGFRSVIFAAYSFIFNVLYATFHAVLGIISHSGWYGSLAIYYISISLIRGGLVAVARKKRKRKYDLEKDYVSYRNCGIYIVLLNLALIAPIVLMVVENQGFKYAGLMIYVMAFYTFYKLSLSIYNLFKARKNKDYNVQAIKNISFADALVSLLALQTALLQAFGGEGETFSVIANSITGGVVSLCVIAMGVIMIVEGSLRLKKQRQNKKVVIVTENID